MNNPPKSFPPSSGYLYISDDRFESLLKSIKLLRIAQLRYIVHKFSLPISGNKSKLLILVCQILKSLRYSPLLLQIQEEVNQLLLDQNDQYISQSNSVQPIQIPNIVSDFIFPDNPFYQLVSNRCFFGPIQAPAGKTNGNFTFNISDVSDYFIDFGFLQGQTHSFSFQCEIDGISYQISPNDPFPQPIHISLSLITPTIPHIFIIKNLETPVPLLIAIHNYKMVDLRHIASVICGHQVTFEENPYALGKHCSHNPFPLFPYLSSVLSSGNWKCPKCDQILSPSSIVYAEPPKNSQPENEEI